jgi:hypothetical protein
LDYWLDLFTPYTGTRHGATVSGFRPRQRKAAFERVKQGDVLLCYLVKLSRWCGSLEVVSSAFEDTTPIFADDNDPFPIRFKVKPLVMLDFEDAIPINEPTLWNALSFTRELAIGSVGWAQAAKLRQSLIEIPKTDGELLAHALLHQQTEKKKWPLDAADLRHIANRTVVRTQEGEIEVEIPEREDEVAADTAAPSEVRASIKTQAKIAQIGATIGFGIWVPPSDRGKIVELLPSGLHDKLVTSLPLNYDTATLKTIENFDVIWLQRRSIAHAFEVEHTTAIYSGLLRMADLLAMQPRIDISLHIIAPIERRDQVRREIIRPVFSVLEGGAMSERCSFLSYDAVEEILALRGLAHMNETIIEEYEEFFDA